MNVPLKKVVRKSPEKDSQSRGLSDERTFGLVAEMERRQATFADRISRFVINKKSVLNRPNP